MAWWQAYMPIFSESWVRFPLLLFEPDEGHLLLDVQLADGRLELLERDEAVLVGVGLRDDPVDDVLQLVVAARGNKVSLNVGEMFRSNNYSANGVVWMFNECNSDIHRIAKIGLEQKGLFRTVSTLTPGALYKPKTFVLDLFRLLLTIIFALFWSWI